jgi:dCMP deaminase
VECSKMVISVGINRVVSLASYSEDGTEILTQAKVTLVRMKKSKLLPWVAYLDTRMNSETL